jgi:hypothetical protein
MSNDCSHAYIHNNRRTVGSGVLCVVRAEAYITQPLTAIVSCETGASQQEQRPWNMKAEEFIMLGAYAKQQTVKTKQTEKTQYVL